MPKPEDVLEFWNERAAIHEHYGKYTRDQAEIIARSQTSRHFGFDCLAIVQAERLRMAEAAKARKVELLATYPGVRTERQIFPIRRKRFFNLLNSVTQLCVLIA